MLEFFTSGNTLVLFWLVLVIAFVVGELISVGLTSIWFAVGSLVAMLIASLHGSFIFQLIAFFAVSIVMLFATRPWAKKYINGKAAKTNADSIVGQEIKIAESVNNIDQTGMAVVRGQEWTVRAVNDKDTFAVGEMARVVSINGVKLMVEKIVPVE